MKIHICGIYGSGKTTLAKDLSQLYKIPHYSLDDIKYKIKYSEIRSVEERLDEVKKISKKISWITEGTWSNYAEELFKQADLIVFLAIPKRVCSYRILKRYFKRKKELNDTLIETLKLVKQVYRYHFSSDQVSKKSHKNLIKKHNKRVFIIKKNRDIFELKKKLIPKDLIKKYGINNLWIYNLRKD